jgi:hypothetical protein
VSALSRQQPSYIAFSPFAISVSRKLSNRHWVCCMKTARKLKKTLKKHSIGMI